MYSLHATQSRSRISKALIWAPFAVLFVVFVVLLTNSEAKASLSAAVRPPVSRISSRSACHATARKNAGVIENFGKGAVALGLAGAMTFGTPLPSMASEFDLLDAAQPTNEYIMDDAPVLQKGSEKKINEELKYLEVGKGYKLNIVTTRKLEDSADAEVLGSKMLEKWNKGNEKDTSGVLVLVAKNNEVAIVGGESFMKALGEDAAGSISGETVGYFASEGRPNQGVTDGVKRINAILSGEADPGPPQIKQVNRERTYKTKDEVESSKGASITVVGTLLLIAFVVPMLQYAGYVQKD